MLGITLTKISTQYHAAVEQSCLSMRYTRETTSFLFFLVLCVVLGLLIFVFFTFAISFDDMPHVHPQYVVVVYVLYDTVRHQMILITCERLSLTADRHLDFFGVFPQKFLNCCLNSLPFYTTLNRQ